MLNPCWKKTPITPTSCPICATVTSAAIAPEPPLVTFVSGTFVYTLAVPPDPAVVMLPPMVAISRVASAPVPLPPCKGT